MKNSATTIEINSKLVKLSWRDKMKKMASSLMSQLVISIVVTLFTQLIKIKALECLSGFCYPHKSNKRQYETN